MQVTGHLYAGAAVLKKYKIAATLAAGTGAIGGSGAVAGVINVSTTNATEYIGLVIDGGTYSTTQGADEGIVTVDFRPDCIVKARASGSATAGTALTACTNTSASAGGTTVTATGVQANDMKGGTAWCISGANVGLSRVVTTHTGSTSFVVVVPFPRAIAVGDVFLMVPWAQHGDFAASSDGSSVQLGTVFTEADATVASGTGCQTCVVELEMQGASNSSVFFIFTDHVANAGVLA